MTGGTVFLASTHTAPTPPAPTVSPASGATSEFTGLAHDAISPEFLCNLSASDQFEFNAPMAHMGDLTMSVNWRHHSTPFNFAHLNVATPDQHVHTVINPSTKPFFINTGASVHISNMASDFYSLHPISPCVINRSVDQASVPLGLGTYASPFLMAAMSHSRTCFTSHPLPYISYQYLLSVGLTGFLHTSPPLSAGLRLTQVTASFLGCSTLVISTPYPARPCPCSTPMYLAQ
ncbi:hypothetical protein PAXRUDRAFT_162460 [Paxillus rubicundulus Ve08.2h10]|uniref:Uncharacterized protein n=1 Tax=Paxillus rubicundulus Ve08.2h10 TaxID=930991 RepID=A0A0D0D5V9_9AGAM|nr:hypothetical protein PAXRUDRAFT_162460 [Paxillus rubicundulus Ve08.2h10]